MKLIHLITAALLFPSVCFAQAAKTKCVTVTPTVVARTYATGEVMGGQMTFTNIFGGAGSGQVTSVAIADKAGQAVDMDLILARGPLTSGTTDSAAFDPTDAELSLILGAVNFGSSSRFAYADNSTHYVGGLLNTMQNPLSATPTKNLYATMVSRGSFIIAGTTDLSATVCVAQD